MINGKRWNILTGVINPPSNNQTNRSAIRLPSGVRIHALEWWAGLTAGNNVNASFDAIALRIGNLQREVNVLEHDDILSLDGPQCGIDGDNILGNLAAIPFPFSQSYRDTASGRENFALDLPSGVVAYAELQYRSLAAAPSLTVKALVEPLEFIAPEDRNLDSRGLPLIEKWYRTAPVAGGLSNDFDDVVPALKPGVESKGRVQSIHLYDPTGATISSVDIRIDGENVFETVTKREADLWLSRNSMFPVAGRFDIVPDIFNKNSDAWDMSRAKSLKLKVNYSAAASGTVPIITKVFGPLD